jgi:hypothetical protein
MTASLGKIKKQKRSQKRRVTQKYIAATIDEVRQKDNFIQCIGSRASRVG